MSTPIMYSMAFFQASTPSEEEFVNLSDRRENCRPRRCVINTLKEMLTLKDEVLDRIFDGIEDALANPANIKGCEFCSGRKEAE